MGFSAARRIGAGIAFVSAVLAMPAYSAVIVSSTNGGGSYGLPATFTFDAPTPEYSGTLYTNSVNGVRAQPAGSTGGYAAVGLGGSAVLDLSAFGDISSISMLWGSVDKYNKLQLLSGSTVIDTIWGGSNGIVPADGNKTSAASNRLVTFTLTGATQSAVTGIRFSSLENAFEFDNVNIVTSAVPEPASWLAFLVGFGAIGAMVRRKQTTQQYC